METEKRDRMEMDGEVVNTNKGQFVIKVNDNLNVLCTLSGKIRTNSVKILVGDSVRIEVSQYDTTKGRIIYRHKSA
jgi:translation initiation factor IF-1